MADTVDDVVTAAREAGAGVDDRRVGTSRIRITPDVGTADAEYYELVEDDNGNVKEAVHYGAQGQQLGTVPAGKLRGELGLD